MEALRNYITDSESDEEDLSESLSKDVVHNVGGELVSINRTMNSEDESSKGDNISLTSEEVKEKSHKAYSSATRTDTEGMNFFNLHNDEDDDDFETKPPHKKMRTETKVVNRKGEEISIPGSDFWSNVTPEEAKALSDVPLEEPKGRKEMSTCRQNRKDNTQLSPLPASSINRERKITDRSRVNTLTHKEISNVERQLFYVHSKVSPHLSKSKSENRAPSKLEKEIPGHSGVVNRVMWNIPNYSHLFLSVSMDTTIKIWNIWSQLEPCVKVLSVHRKAVKDAVWSLCGRQILSCGYDKMAALTNVETGQQLARFESSSFVTSCKVHPVDPHLCITGANNIIQAWDYRCPNRPCHKYVYKDNYGQVQDLVFNRDGDTFFSASDELSRDSSDRNIMAWDFRSTVVLSNQIYQERYSCTRLKVHQKGGHLLAQSHGNYIAIFSLSRPFKMNKAKRFEGHKLSGYSVGFDVSPDGNQIVSGDASGKLFVYNYQSSKIFRTLSTGLDICLDIAFHPVLPSTIACCGWNGSIQVWH